MYDAKCFHIKLVLCIYNVWKLERGCDLIKETIILTTKNKVKAILFV